MTVLSRTIAEAIRWPWRAAERWGRGAGSSRATVGVVMAGYHEKLGGVGNYAMSLLKAWSAIRPFDHLRIFCTKTNFASVGKLPFRARIEHRFLHDTTSLTESARDCDIVFYPCGHIEPVPPPTRSAFHLADLQEWFFPENFSDEEVCRRRNRYRSLREFGVSLLVPSDFTRRSVIELLEYDPERVFICPLLSADLPRKGRSPRSFAFPDDGFAYFPADDYPHKNHQRLVEALKRLAASGLKIPLVCSGSRVGDARWKEMAAKDGLLVHDLGRVSREEVRWLYEHCRVVVFPSLFEGFGIPVLEALQLGCCVLSSSAASLPEVGGDAVHYCNPFDVEDMANALSRVWRDENLRRSLRARTSQQASRFSERRMVQLHRETFDRIANLPDYLRKGKNRLPTLDPVRAWKAVAGRQRPPVTGSGAFPLSKPEQSSRRIETHFLTLAFNGMPFLQKQWEILNTLSIDWHWHVIEGIAELTGDTAWSARNNGMIPREFSGVALSQDGTTAFLDSVAAQKPHQVSIYRSESRWDGKRAMCEAPLPTIKREVLLWQLDVDEFWEPETIVEVVDAFSSDSELMAAQFRCRFYVSPKHVLDNVGTYGNDTRCEWRRVWRFRPGDSWRTHEPPVLVRGGRDLFESRSLTQDETAARGWTFRHLAYVMPSQVAFKESYYGYTGATKGWSRILAEDAEEIRVGAYLPWVPGDLWAVSEPLPEPLHQMLVGKPLGGV